MPPLLDPKTALERLAAAVPPNVREVCATLAKAGFQAVTVGGAVRDALLGRTPGDWDVATSAPPETVIGLFRRTVPTGLQHGTVTIVTGRGEHTHVEVTTFRGEGAYTDARRPDHVTFGVPLVEDLARRDLRVNAMAFDPATGTLIDPYEGQRDLAEGLLRAVGPTGNVFEDAVARFTEDGLRVMRAVRFAAALELPLDPDTVRGIVPALPSLAKVSRERVSDELRKLLATREPSRGLRPALATTIIAAIAPLLATGLAAWADEARWLARVDRTATTDGIANRLGAMWIEASGTAAGLSAAEGRRGSIEAGGTAAGLRLDRTVVKQLEAALKALKFSNEEATRAAVIAASGRALLVADWTEVAVRRLLADLTRAHAAAAVAVWRADGGAPALVEHADVILARGDALATGELAITGGELMAELALPPGPAIGKLLATLTDLVLADPARNDRAALVDAARALTASGKLP